MKSFTSFLRSTLVCILLGVVSFSFASQSAKANPGATLVPLGGCCYEVHYWIPNFEANRWISCQVTPSVPGVQSASPTFGFAVTPTPNPTVLFTHPAGTGAFPFGANLNMGVVCFNFVGPAVVFIKFTDRLGVVVIIPIPVIC